jgi:glycosyltransferase involved in cell wall biosynthesis
VHDIKGQDIAIQAMRILVHEHGLVNCKLHLIGEGPSLPYLRQLTQDLNLSAYVHFAGIKDRAWIMQNLCEYNVLIQPSLFEGFGLTVLEGIAAGIPVVASNIDGPAEILQNMPSGFLFPSKDSQQLATVIWNIMYLYSQNKVAELSYLSYAEA